MQAERQLMSELANGATAEPGPFDLKRSWRGGVEVVVKDKDGKVASAHTACNQCTEQHYVAIAAALK